MATSDEFDQPIMRIEALVADKGERPVIVDKRSAKPFDRFGRTYFAIPSAPEVVERQRVIAVVPAQIRM
jgi:hypothetical protein